MLRVDALAVGRGGRLIVEGVSFEVAPREIVGVVGDDGGGKSTLLTCIAGVLPPRDGTIELDGASV